MVSYVSHPTLNACVSENPGIVALLLVKNSASASINIKVILSHIIKVIFDKEKNLLRRFIPG